MNTQISFKQLGTSLHFSQLQDVDEALACSRGQNPSLRAELTTSGWLLGLNGLHNGEDLRLYPGSNVIGSSARCDIVLTAPGVGRQHAIIDVLSGESALLQPGSTQRELFINDALCVSPAPLCHGDVLRIGEQSFAYIALLPSRKDEQTVIHFRERFPARANCTLGWLVELAGDRIGRDFRLIQGENRIGSQYGLEVVLFDPEIQPRHAIMTRHADNWIIVPVSVNEPIFVNGVPSTGTGLHNGDIVRLGQREFLFRSIKVAFAK
jgi:pSer/pThr/pTyr-binding forkhead associated (FHA) protein